MEAYTSSAGRTARNCAEHAKRQRSVRDHSASDSHPPRHNVLQARMLTRNPREIRDAHAQACDRHLRTDGRTVEEALNPLVVPAGVLEDQGIDTNQRCCLTPFLCLINSNPFFKKGA
jgi:hypothetical protein